jgi:hypothetical protein
MPLFSLQQNITFVRMTVDSETQKINFLVEIVEHLLKFLDSGFHRNDDSWAFLPFDESIINGRKSAFSG